MLVRLTLSNIFKKGELEFKPSRISTFQVITGLPNRVNNILGGFMQFPVYIHLISGRKK
jgi:hypothetical protein